MKRIIFMIGLMVLLAGSVSAATWDNVGNYHPETQTMEIRSSVLGFSWWQLDPVANLTLLTPKHNFVFAGEDVLVAHIKVEIFEEIDTPLSELRFYEYLKNIGKQKSFTYKRLKNENVVVNDIEVQCGNNVNGTYVCQNVTLATTHVETIKTWQNFNHVGTVPVGTYHIGIFTDVDPGERTEWIPNYFGVEINEWADFTGLTKYEWYETGQDDVSYPRSAGPRWSAQTFTIGTTGTNEVFTVKGISTYMNRDAGSNATYTWMILGTNASGAPDKSDVKCYSGLIGTEIYASASWAFYNLSLEGCGTLDTSTTYAIAVNTTNADDGNRASWGRDSGSATYGGGETFTSTDGGSTWGGLTGDQDLLFQVWGELPKPDVTLNTPADNYVSLYENVTLNCSGESSLGVLNLTLVLDDVENYTITNTTANQNLSFELTQNVSFASHNWSCKSTNTNGQAVSSTRDFNITAYTEVGQNFSNTTTEGSNELFQINITVRPDKQVSSAVLVYNGTRNTGSWDQSGTSYFISETITVPLVDAGTNNTFYWEISMDDSSIANSTFNNQTVGNLGVDNCSSYTELMYNFTLYDEETKSFSNPANANTTTTIEVQLLLFDNTHTINLLNYSEDYNDTNPAQICFETALTSQNYSADLTVRYYSNVSNIDYAIEYYNLLRDEITNDTLPRQIALYDLKAEDSTDFQLTFKDENLVLAPNILVYLYRQYVADNVFRVVEIPITDSNGQTILHLVRNDVIYNLIMVDENKSIVATFNNQRAFCKDHTIGQCTINLNAVPDQTTIFNYTEDSSISYTNPTFSNSTNLVSMSFTSLNLSELTVKMEVLKAGQFGNRSVCSDTLTSVSGSLSCSVANIVSTDRFLFVDIYVNGIIKATHTIDLAEENFGIVEGSFFAFLIILFIATMFMNDRQALVVALVIGWIVVIAIGLVKGALFGLGSAGIWLVVSAIIMLWKLRKEETT